MSDRPHMLNSGERRENRVLSVVLAVALFLILGISALNIWVATCFELVLVDGPSMEETLQNGDSLYISLHGEVERGDIVVIDVTGYPDLFPTEGGGEHYIIKRIIGLEGDAIYAEDGVVYRQLSGEDDFTPLSEDYVKGETIDFGPVEVGENEIFFLGDHRSVSKDSSRVGCLALSDVVGVVTDFSLAHKDLITGWVNFWHSGSV